MRKKYIKLIVVFVVWIYVFTPGFLQINAQQNNAKKQPAVCAGPSETMSEYFSFQKEALAALIGSEAYSKTLSTSASDGRLFTKNKLSLPSSALDYVVDNVWGKTSSVISTARTSLVLLLFASVSVIESDVEGFAILFKDRAIVRDYKQMLDIDTEIFDVAFSFSQSIDLTRSFNGDALENFDAVVKKYQKSGLLRKGESYYANDSMSSILYDLVSMNASMKYFIAMGGESGASELRKYAGCLRHYKTKDNCTTHFVLGFNFDAVEKLKEEYSGIWRYGVCNSYASNFENTLSKSAENNANSVSVAINDVKIAWRNLVNALIGKGAWSKVFTDPCEMNDYQRAQIDAYWGGNRTCGEGVSVSSLISRIKGYSKRKKTLAGDGDEKTDLVKESSSSTAPSLLDVMEELNGQKDIDGKNVSWYGVYGGKSSYNPEFSNSMNDEFIMVFEDITEQFGHSQRAAMASDLSYELVKIKGLVNQVDAAMASAEKLEKHLQDIKDYQCSM